jgi:DNA-binding CsgD family transcriptional regulator
VTRALRKAGVPLRARGAGRPRPVRRVGDPPDLPRRLRELYVDDGLGSPQIAAILGMPERTVRDRLRRYGIQARTRGKWNREDRATAPAAELRALYAERGMTAAETGQRLGMSANTVLRSAHALGLPVRVGGAVPLPGLKEIELVSALYADPLVDAVLTVHDVPRVPPGGPIAVRFPRPVPLTTPLVKDLYWECGVGLNHIELLTGQAAETVRAFMRRSGIPLRQAGGRTPFVRRWQADPTPLTFPYRPRLSSAAAQDHPERLPLAPAASPVAGPRPDDDAGQTGAKRSSVMSWPGWSWNTALTRMPTRSASGATSTISLLSRGPSSSSTIASSWGSASAHGGAVGRSATVNV